MASVSTFDSNVSACDSATSNSANKTEYLVELAEKLRYLNINFTASENKHDENDS
jgi:hypothetical protein